MINFLFDVDGTLTEARKSIDNDFRKFFGEWVTRRRTKGHRVFLVTGSDKPKTIEQIGVPLYRNVNGCYQSCGNEFFIRNRPIKKSEWKMSEEMRQDIMSIVRKSKWYGKAEQNIEERVGMANLSTVGRTANDVLRREYYNWDKHSSERLEIVHILSERYPELDFAIGGEISVDFYPKGKDKSQVISDMKWGANIFFGDRCDEGGNDHSIAMASDIYHDVDNWQQTKMIIEKRYEV
jgi:phosphomannomutase